MIVLSLAGHRDQQKCYPLYTKNYILKQSIETIAFNLFDGQRSYLISVRRQSTPGEHVNLMVGHAV